MAEIFAGTKFRSRELIFAVEQMQRFRGNLFSRLRKFGTFSREWLGGSAKKPRNFVPAKFSSFKVISSFSLLRFDIRLYIFKNMKGARGRLVDCII